MPHKNLRKLGPGFYMDEQRSLYFDIREFLSANRLPDEPEVRRAIWDEVRRDFGLIDIHEIGEEEEED